MFLLQGFAMASVLTDELWLSPKTTMNHGGHHDGGQRPEKAGVGRSTDAGHSGHESEHRPQPVRKYWLNTCGISDNAKAYFMHPEGDYSQVPVERDNHDISVTVKTPFGEGPAHGANNVYLVDQLVHDDVLIKKTAKWVVVHHNCGWGHDHKFNEKRLHPQSLPEVPLEIVVDDLWDSNFHSNVMSGDTINLQVLSYGKPAPNASVTVVSDKGWSKNITTDDQGRASFQLVRDYYPESWSLFNRQHLGTIKLSAVYTVPEKGDYNGQPYESVLMNSSFSWRYYPARKEYVSYAYGLVVVGLFMVVSGIGVYGYRERRKKPYREIRFDE